VFLELFLIGARTIVLLANVWKCLLGLRTLSMKSSPNLSSSMSSVPNLNQN